MNEFCKVAPQVETAVQHTDARKATSAWLEGARSSQITLVPSADAFGGLSSVFGTGAVSLI